MRLARAIEVLRRRREWLIEHVELSKESSRSWMTEEKLAIDEALPVLEAELERRHIAVMNQRIDHQREARQ